ncbi:hypothetical protein PCAR4_350039 [Paraburkholderia caribensis]|nr:hypothetical protein PCAR4_350039 [Paraburkholderia caribensis]
MLYASDAAEQLFDSGTHRFLSDSSTVSGPYGLPESSVQQYRLRRQRFGSRLRDDRVGLPRRRWVPGLFYFLKNGVDVTHESTSGTQPSGLYSPSFDFNDALLPIGATPFVRLVESYLKLCLIRFLHRGPARSQRAGRREPMQRCPVILHHSQTSPTVLRYRLVAFRHTADSDSLSTEEKAWKTFRCSITSRTE